MSTDQKNQGKNQKPQSTSTSTSTPTKKDFHFEPSTESTKNEPTPEKARELKQKR